MTSGIRKDTPLRVWMFSKSRPYASCRAIFFAPILTTFTLDDDLYVLRSKENQDKTLSARKAEKQGHIADVVCDALSRFTLGVRFRRRG